MNEKRNSSDAVLTIDAVSDFVSPWCYLAHRRLRAALDEVEGASSPRVRWLPFELNPAVPPDGMNVDRYLESVFGSTHAGWTVLGKLEDEGRHEGIAFDFRRVRSIPNTLDAHRLMLLAEEEGRDGAMADRLFRGFLEEGLDIGSRDVLVNLADDVGVRGENVRRFLEGRDKADVVRVRESTARSAGLTGVPTFVVNGQVAVLGLQEPEILLAAIDRALFSELPADPNEALLH